MKQRTQTPHENKAPRTYRPTLRSLLTSHDIGRMPYRDDRGMISNSPCVPEQTRFSSRVAMRETTTQFGNTLRPTLFLDRDGTINRHIGYLDRPEQIELLPGVGAAIRRLNQAGVLAVVVTNQAVIARGQCTATDLEQIHARLKEELAQHGAHLDALYHCPHHPDCGQPGEVAELKIVCRCRKPEPGMIEAALRDLPIDPNKCAVVGDTERDVGLAFNSRLPCFWITSAAEPLPAHATRVEHLSEAVDLWLNALGLPVTGR